MSNQTLTTEPASRGTNSVEQVDAPEFSIDGLASELPSIVEGIVEKNEKRLQKYNDLLTQLKEETSTKAKYYVPKLAQALSELEMSADQIRMKIYADLEGIWAHGTITNALPSEYKDKVKANNAKRRKPEAKSLLTENEQKQEPSGNTNTKQQKKETLPCDEVRITLYKNGKILKRAEFRQDGDKMVVVENDSSRLTIHYLDRDFHLPT
jgi:hypothetical protein